MRFRPSPIILVLSCLFALPCFGSTAKSSVVTVTLLDSSTDAGKGNMSLSVDHAAVKAGRVTFRAVNQSRKLIHEVIIIKIDPSKSIPYDERRGQVIEARVKRLGEIADLQPGATGSISLDMGAGSYLLICNQPGHFKAGMATRLTVK